MTSREARLAMLAAWAEYHGWQHTEAKGNPDAEPTPDTFADWAREIAEQYTDENA